ncbi:MAG: NADH-quinone oxidoreductase subunit H [Gammaproteobacteria bacterium]|jgi:NADH-quinone oxidoreductase subunit H|nr:NADH-quinone oxidoreductase subunit H [Gammaproteobacteria bacterium]MDH3887219.1 NADH-quinone oxidoreductase subunit H [Gammaproteobacteria bacterium]MDH3934959.1 NADH-quinone oxidoreductase subunit H [Gammaproteobacteria bacterium]MDH3985593.1 NADH-quinone oxidoreductase subunit H [Gammaproteobacteria bacterium]
MLEWLGKVGDFSLTLLIVTLYGLLVGAYIERVIAKVQGRIGIPYSQPFINILKNFFKRTAVSHGVMFYLGPVFRIAGGIGTLAFIPVIYGNEMFSNFSMSGDLFLVIYFMFFGQLGMALGAGESGHPYSAIGIARGLSQMTAYEVPFALAVISIVIQYDTLSITEIVAAQQGGWQNWTLFTNWVATLAAMLAFLGMTGYSPFDIFLAPQEIPIGPPTEFHSAYLGLLQTNRALFGATKLILFMNLFFGGATGWVELMIKTLLIYMVAIVVGVAFPRFRVDQGIRFFLKIPTVIGILSIIYVQMVLLS